MASVKLQNGQFEFMGRLEAFKKVDTQNGVKFIHKFLIPSPDNYSSPTQLYVGSPRQICDVGKDASVAVSVYGWSRKKNGQSFQNHALEEVI
jgi:hypothetical protein